MWADLACPVDQGRLSEFKDWLACESCGRGYPVVDGIPRFLSADDSPRWRDLQHVKLALLDADEDASRQVQSRLLRQGGRAIERRLAQFAQLSAKSRLIQVGCSGEAELHHFRRGIRYVLEPLAGTFSALDRLRTGEVRWVAARGEELPFCDKVIDAALLVHALDGAQSPRDVLAETRRTLRADGVCWLSCRVHHRGARPRMHPPAPRLWNFTAAELIRLCRQAGLDPQWRGLGCPIGEDGKRGAPTCQLILTPGQTVCASTALPGLHAA